MIDFFYVVAILLALFSVIYVVAFFLARAFDRSAKRNYDDDAEALVGVNHPTNRLTRNSVQVP